MRSIYDTMLKSEVLDDKGRNYLDVMTTEFEKFTHTKTLVDYNLNDIDIDRIDYLMYRIYGVSEYDDLVLAFNGKYKNELETEQVIYFPDIDDVSNYFKQYRKNNL